VNLSVDATPVDFGAKFEPMESVVAAAVTDCVMSHANKRCANVW
jgi:hypothetical protein